MVEWDGTGYKIVNEGLAGTRSLPLCWPEPLGYMIPVFGCPLMSPPCPL